MVALAPLALVGLAAAQPPWLPWKIENKNLVSGLTKFPYPAGCKPEKQGGNCVWIQSETSPSVEACLAACEADDSCNSFDFQISWQPKPGETGICKFRSDHFFPRNLNPGTGFNHTCGTRVKPAPPPGPPPLPPLPPPPPVKPPLGKQPNLVFFLTDDQDRTLGENDYTRLGSLAVMPNVNKELIAKGAFLQNFFVNTPICCPSRTEFFSGRYYHNIGPPGDPGKCMHVDTANAVHPLTSMFGLIKRAGYNVGVFGKVTNDQSTVLKEASSWDSMTYIDSPLNYNNFDGTSYWRKFANGTFFTENIDPEDPSTCGGTVIDGSNTSCTPYQTAQIGNRTMRWLQTVLSEQAQAKTSGAAPAAKPFFAYLGPHAPHYPATPAPWYETAFWGTTIPITPNYNLSSPDKTQHIRQNPPFTDAVKCWEDQHFRDRWRSLLSVDDLVGDVVAALTEAGEIDNTYIFYSSDHGYKQGQWRVGTSKQHPYDTDIRVPLLARGPGIAPGSVHNQPSGNVDLTPTMLTLAAGPGYVPEFMDGKSMTAFLTPGLVPTDDSSTWRAFFLNEYKSVGTYYNDHSKCWGNDMNCPGTMPRGPDPELLPSGSVVIEGADYTIFKDVGADASRQPSGCVESTGVGDGNCYFVDSEHSNNWRQLRIVGGADGVDMNYVEYDPNWAFNDTSAMQHFELYDVAKDKYQVHNIYNSQTAAKREQLHKLLDEYWKCGSPVIGSIGSNFTMPAGRSTCP